MVPTRLSSPVEESFHHCRHPQQRHPFYAEAFLLCAWPECPRGTLRTSIDVTVGASLAASRTELAVFERQEQPGGRERTFRWSRRWPR
jgi:hypothetical protein